MQWKRLENYSFVMWLSRLITTSWTSLFVALMLLMLLLRDSGSSRDGEATCGDNRDALNTSWVMASTRSSSTLQLTKIFIVNYFIMLCLLWKLQNFALQKFGAPQILFTLSNLYLRNTFSCKEEECLSPSSHWWLVLQLQINPIALAT